ncbi:HU family DNA-binding protein [Parabacteroides sp.]
MNKQELTYELALQTGLTQTKSKEVIESLLDIITEQLRQGGEIRLTGFAVLSRWHQTQRLARNPKTGEPYMVSERFSVKLKPGKQLLEEINKPTTNNKSK